MSIDLPGLVDAHVHLGLVDAAALRAGGVAGADDLGWDPTVAQSWTGPELPDVRYAGAFLTAPGGYPSGRSWAPGTAVDPVTSPDGAAAAVARQARRGAGLIKVVLHDGGPCLDDVTLTALVASAHARGLPVVAHTEGAGMTARALAAGVDKLAHTPWTERLDDTLIARAAARQTWISTLDIHGWGSPTAELEVALDNLRRFHGAGGAVVYGTDLGNGPLPVGLNLRELRLLAEAGLSPAALLGALTSRPVPGLRTRIAGGPLDLARITSPDLIERLTSARVVAGSAEVRSQ